LGVVVEEEEEQRLRERRLGTGRRLGLIRLRQPMQR
jgi:hypothetical protein